MSQKRAELILNHLKETHQFFCWSPEGMFTAEQLLSIVKGKPVSFDEALDFITS